MEVSKKAPWLLIVVLVSLLFFVVMAARMPIPQAVADDAEMKSELTKAQMLAEINKLRVQGKKYKPQYYKPGAFPSEGVGGKPRRRVPKTQPVRQT